MMKFVLFACLLAVASAVPSLLAPAPLAYGPAITSYTTSYAAPAKILAAPALTYAHAPVYAAPAVYKAPLLAAPAYGHAHLAAPLAYGAPLATTYIK